MRPVCHEAAQGPPYQRSCSTGVGTRAQIKPEPQPTSVVVAERHIHQLATQGWANAVCVTALYSRSSPAFDRDAAQGTPAASDGAAHEVSPTPGFVTHKRTPDFDSQTVKKIESSSPRPVTQARRCQAAGAISSPTRSMPFLGRARDARLHSSTRVAAFEPMWGMSDILARLQRTLELEDPRYARMPPRVLTKGSCKFLGVGGEGSGVLQQAQ